MYLASHGRAPLIDGQMTGLTQELAMSAKGTSTIDNIEQIDRGYEDIEGRLNALGAHITRA